MNTYQLAAFIIGAFIGSFLLTGILYLCTKGWRGQYGKAVFIHSIAAIIAILLSAIGNADGAPPNFGASGYYLVSQTILLAMDLVRLRARRVRATKAVQATDGI